MNLVASLSDQIDRLVHPSTHESPVAMTLHRSFIATRLAVSLCAIALIPLNLASGHVPGWADALVLAALTLPMVAAAHVAKTGRLVEGEVISLVAWFGLALVVFFGGIGGPAVSVTLLLVMLLEANFCASLKVMGRAMLAALGATLVLVAVTTLGEGAAMHAANPIFFTLAAIYGSALSFEGSRCRRVREALDQLDAERYRVLSESIGDLVLRFDRGGAVLGASQSAERLFGIRSADLMRRGFFERVHVADRPAFLQMIGDAANGLDNVSGTLRLRLHALPSADGPYEEPVFAWVEMRSRRLDGIEPLAGLIAPGVVAVVRDITTRIEHERQIERAKRDAEEASAWKDRFLATVSHELRTPLNAIIGFGEILSSDVHIPADSAKRHEYAEIIHSSGQHLLSVVNSLLDLSKIDLGRFDLIVEPFDMAELVGSCCDMVGLKAEQQRIALVRDFAAAGEIMGDTRACKQIVINLLSNALKFTPAGGTVTVRLRPDGPTLELAVVDTGIGIKAVDMARLGDPFFQVQNTYDRAYDGTGLGLSVVNGLVGLHGGTVTVDSTPGQGTAMVVRLPRDGRGQRDAAQPRKTRIEVLPRFPRPAAVPPVSDPMKVHKIA